MRVPPVHRGDHHPAGHPVFQDGSVELLHGQGSCETPWRIGANCGAFAGVDGGAIGGADRHG